MDNEAILAFLKANWIMLIPVAAYVLANIWVAATKSTDDDAALRRIVERLSGLQPLNAFGSLKLPGKPRGPLVLPLEPPSEPKKPTGLGVPGAMVLMLFAGCSISKLDATTRTIGGYRIAHNLTVKTLEITIRIRAEEVARECVEEIVTGDHEPGRCGTLVTEYIASWEPVRLALESASTGAEVITAAAMRWAQAVDDGEGDDDELPLDLQTELATFCPKVDGLLDHLEARDVRVPSLVRSAHEEVCDG